MKTNGNGTKLPTLRNEVLDEASAMCRCVEKHLANAKWSSTRRKRNDASRELASARRVLSAANKLLLHEARPKC